MIISFLKKLDNNIFKIVLYSTKSILNPYQNFIFENILISTSDTNIC